MKKFIATACMVGCFLIISGCSSEADDLMKDQLKLMNEWADAIEKNEPESRMNDIQKRMEELGKRSEKLKLSDDEKKKLEERYKDDIVKTSTRLQKAMMSKFGVDPGKLNMPSQFSKKG